MKYYLIILCTLLLAACTKLRDKNRIAFGKIVDSVNAPIANAEFVLLTIEYDGSISASNGMQYETEYRFKTDGDGAFKVDFKAKKREDICITYPGMSPESGQYYWSDDAGQKLEFNAGVIKMPRR